MLHLSQLAPSPCCSVASKGSRDELNCGAQIAQFTESLSGYGGLHSHPVVFYVEMKTRQDSCATIKLRVQRILKQTCMAQPFQMVTL